LPLLPQETAAALRKELEEHLVGEVTLTLVGPSALHPPAQDLTPQIRELYEEVASLSSRVRFQYVELPSAEQREALGLEPGEMGPLTVVSGAARGRVRFLGAPAGHEFSSFVEDLVLVSRGESGLSEASKASLSRLTTPIHIRVFFTPT